MTMQINAVCLLLVSVRLLGHASHTPSARIAQANTDPNRLVEINRDTLGLLNSMPPPPTPAEFNDLPRTTAKVPHTQVSVDSKPEQSKVSVDSKPESVSDTQCQTLVMRRIGMMMNQLVFFTADESPCPLNLKDMLNIEFGHLIRQYSARKVATRTPHGQVASLWSISKI